MMIKVNDILREDCCNFVLVISLSSQKYGFSHGDNKSHERAFTVNADGLMVYFANICS